MKMWEVTDESISSVKKKKKVKYQNNQEGRRE